MIMIIIVIIVNINIIIGRSGSRCNIDRIDYYRYFSLLSVFYTSACWWDHTGILRNSKSPQVSKSLLNFLTDLDNPVV